MDLVMSLDTRDFDQQLDTFEHRAVPADPLIQRGLLAQAEAYFDFIRRRFLNNGNGEWAPLAESTRRQKQKSGEPADALRGKSGDLYRSLTIGQPGNVLEIQPFGIRAGSSDPKLIFHQLGTEHIPARPVLVEPDDETRRRMDSALETAVGELVDAIFSDSGITPA